MARSVTDIQTQIQTELVSAFAAIGITIDPTTWSKRNMMRLFCFVFAVCSAYMEQLWDTLQLEIETTASQAAAASPLWIQNEMFLFQYAAAPNTQYLQMINGVPQYPVVDPTLRIIAACSVTSSTPNEVTIKVAKIDPNNPDSFAALDPSTELSAAQGYINYLGTSGINYTVQSSNPDQIYIAANIYYQGQYSNVISTSVITALNNFLLNLSKTNFNGAVKVSDIEKTIKAVSGVNDAVLVDVFARTDAQAFGAGTQLVLNQALLSRLWNTYAGYCIGEQTAGKTFADSLNFIAE